MANEQSGKSIRINLDAIPRLVKKMTGKQAQYDKLIQKRVTAATHMVWAIAHQKRPIIAAKQMGRLVEHGRFIVREGATRRVSDPDAKAGVPVDTGTLQASVTEKVTRYSKGWQGMIEAGKGAPYAGYMEYGTSNLRARPFMRPAIVLSLNAIRRMMSLKVNTNLDK